MFYSHRLPSLPEVTIGYLSYLVFRGRICFIPTSYLRLPLVTISYQVFRGRICFIPTGYLCYLRLLLVTIGYLSYQVFRGI